MRIDTQGRLTRAAQHGLFLPAELLHAVRMDGPVAMRALFLREDAHARRHPHRPCVAVSPCCAR